MPRTQVNCPNCRQPVVAEIDQLFDLNTDPTAKQRLLSGAVNIVNCQVCGYQGGLATPIVYHDPEKELLLTFVPPELNMARDDQERAIGALINQVMNEREDDLIKVAGEFGLSVAGTIPDDKKIREYDLKGKPTIELDNESSSLKATYDIFSKIID